MNSFRHCTFKHRLPLEKVSTIVIRGDVTMELIGFIDVSKAFFAFDLFSKGF